MSVRSRATARAGKLLDVAEHSATGPAEAHTARRMARALMLRHGLRDADVLPYRTVGVQRQAAAKRRQEVVIYAPSSWVERWGGLGVRISLLGDLRNRDALQRHPGDLPPSSIS